MIDLSTGYLGLKLRSPLVAAASPLSKDIASLRRLEEAGAAAVVLYSLFEEQISMESHLLDRALTEGTDSFPEALSYFPSQSSYGIGPSGYLDHIRKAKRELTIPVIGSLNGVSAGGWVHFAKQMEDAGIDALELNVFFLPASLEVEAGEIERGYCELVHKVKSEVRIPVAVKLAPYFTSVANLASKLDSAGADALVLFNRFYEPDFDLETLEVKPNLVLSTSNELRLRLHWVALLSNRIRPELAISGGVHTGEDAAKGILAGAQVVTMASALLKNGIPYLKQIENGLHAWMEAHEYDSIHQMRGAMNATSVAEPAAFERANYLKVLGSYVARA